MGDKNATAGPSMMQPIINTQLCQEATCEGFDNNMGNTWIYPINKPIRRYQNEIIQKCLFNNTLVILPTGLGKTFIAAVVIYNMYRWFPRGKIIFLAPTKPLVAQQRSSCFDALGIHEEDTIEMTGQLAQKSRSNLWKSKRVFFATPQVVNNDLDEANFPASAIKLIIFDECHKAKGKYAYCEIVRKLQQLNPHFRIIALSATPGRTIHDVVEVVENLQISEIEIRHVDSPDVAQYMHSTKIVTEIVELDSDLHSCRKSFLEIIRPYVENLIKAKAIVGTVESLTKNWLIVQQQKFCTNSQNNPNLREIITDFHLCTSLYHGLELLIRNGLKVFMNFMGEDNPKIHFCFQRDSRLTAFLGEVKDIINRKGDAYFGHPKFDFLSKCLERHFLDNKDSRAIVFCEFRYNVSLILKRLSNLSYLRPKILVGKNNTHELEKTTPKTQRETINDFKSGLCNVLISTSVGEEGLDIGEVDLIICFDMNSKNCSRFVQRIGRTGRKRAGKVIMLVTKGKEEDNLRSALNTQNKTNNQILNNSAVTSSLFKHSHRLVPKQFNPKCLETYMTSVRGTSGQSTSTETSTNTTKKSSNKIVRNKTKNIIDFFKKPLEKANSVELEKDNTIIISDDEDDSDKSNLPVVKKENLPQKVALFENKLNQNKFYSSTLNGSLKTKPRFALIDIANLIGDVEQIKKEVNDLKKVERAPVQKENPVSFYPETAEEFDYRLSQNLSSLCFKYDSLDKMNHSKLSTWSSPTSDSDRFELNVNSVDDLFEGSWISEGNLGHLDHWKGNAKVNMEQTKESTDISDIFSQSVLNGLPTLQANVEPNDNGDLRCPTSEDDSFIPATPEKLSPKISQSIFDGINMRSRLDDTELTQMSPGAKLNVFVDEYTNMFGGSSDEKQLTLQSNEKKLMRSPLPETNAEEELNCCPGTPEQQRKNNLTPEPEMSPSVFDVKNRRRRITNQEVSSHKLTDDNDDETIEASQNYQEISRRAPRLGRLLYGNNSKKSQKKCDLKEIQNKMSSSLNKELQISNLVKMNRTAEEHFDQNNEKDIKSLLSIKNLVDIEVFETEEFSENPLVGLTPKKPRQKSKSCDFIDNEAEVSGDSSDELEDDSQLPDDSIIDHSFNESAFNNSTDMTKFYLQSVKSQQRPYGFKIPEPRTYVDIFSQAVLPADDTVMEDSFISESVEVNTEIDALDRAEAIIKKRSKKRKRGNKVEVTSVQIKKRKYFVVSSDSSS